MKVLIVVAHPNVDKSLNHYVAKAAKAHFEKNKHEVRYVDLYKIKFNPVGGKNDFKKLKNPDFFDYQVEQEHAVKTDNFVDEVKTQMDNLMWADLILYQFPMFWWSYPAILKGFFDKIYAYTFAYGKGTKFPKHVMFSFTSGGNYKNRYQQLYAFDRYSNLGGMKMVVPFIITGVWTGLEKEKCLERQKKMAKEMEKHLDKNVIGKDGIILDKITQV